MGNTRLHAMVPDDLAVDLRDYADRIGISVTAAMILILRQHLGTPAGGRQLTLPAAVEPEAEPEPPRRRHRAK